MFDPAYDKREVLDFRGAWSSVEETDRPSNRAGLAQNVQFPEGRVATRYGYAAVFTPSVSVGSMFNWIYSDPTAGAKNYLLWWSYTTGPKLQYTDLASPAASDVYTQADAYAASYANAGGRVYVGQFGSDGLGKGHGRCVQFVTGSLVGDNLFARPMLTTEVTLGASFGAGGVCTPGIHRFAFILERRSGFIGRPGPAANTTALTLTPTSATATSANKTATITITPATTWPADAVKVHLLATTASNQARWFFVPGGSATVTGGGGVAASLTFNISDADLAQTGEDAGPYLGLLTQSNGNAAPFSPIVIFEAGNRLGYVFNDSVYGQGVAFSQENNYQAISAAYGLYYLPGQRQVVTGFALGGVIYLLGPNWTYATEDTGGYPATWPGAAQVDMAIGTMAPLGVSVNIALGCAWVASKAGLYRFQGGQYDTLPASWRCADQWNRINWAAAHTVQVTDDPVNKRVNVLAPLDAAVVPTHILTFDYTRGTDANSVSFSLDNLGGGAAYNAACMVQNNTTKKLEYWLGPGSNLSAFRRQKNSGDANPYRDDTATGIESAYRTGPMLGPNRPRLSMHHGLTVRARGSGSMTLTAQSLDQQATFAADAVTLSTTPGLEYDRFVDLIAEDAVWYVTNGSVADAYFDVSKITHYSHPWTMQR